MRSALARLENVIELHSVCSLLYGFLPPWPPWSPAIFPWACLVHGQLPSAYGCPMQFSDGLLGLGIVGHLDKAKAARTAGLAVLNDRRRLDSTDTGEQILEVLAR